MDRVLGGLRVAKGDDGVKVNGSDSASINHDTSAGESPPLRRDRAAA